MSILELLLCKMSDGYMRKHETGTQKRLKKQKRDEDLKKLQGSMLNYVTVKRSKPAEVERGTDCRPSREGTSTS